MSKSGQAKVAEIITNRILEQLENGVVPWHKPWIGTNAAWNRRNGKPYALINQMLLGCTGEYATFNAIAKEGGHVNKGAKASYALEFFRIDRQAKDEDGNLIIDEDTGEPMTRTFWGKRYEKVFNIEDTDLEPKYHQEDLHNFDGEPIDIAQQCFDHYIGKQGITLSHRDKGRAYYSPGKDIINLPDFDQFKVVEEYYSTAFHEAAHSTGHKSRLDRLDRPAAKGSTEYGKEELVAELTSAAVCNILGIEIESTFDNSAAYIDNWTKAIKGGEADIISASGLADKAMNMILDGFEYTEPVEEDETDVVTIKNATGVMELDVYKFIENRNIPDIRKLVRGTIAPSVNRDDVVEKCNRIAQRVIVDHENMVGRVAENIVKRATRMLQFIGQYAMC